MKTRLLIFSIMAMLMFACDNYDDISTVQSESFIKFYALNQSNEAAGICPLSDGGYALLGNTETITRGTDICLILTDEYGNSIQEPKLYGGTGDDWGYCIKEAPDGGFIILGSKQKEAGDDKDVYLIRTNRLGDTLWTQTYPYNDEDDEGYWFDMNDNSDIMMVGYCTTTTVRSAWHYLVDQNGHRIDSYIAKAEQGDEARYVQRIKDGWLVTGVISSTRQVPVWFITNDYLIMAWYEQENGSEININEQGNAITVIDDKTAFVCGTVSDNAGGSELLFYKLNGNYVDDKLIWRREETKPFSHTGDEKGTSVITQNNKIYILSTRSSGDKNSIISIITTDLDGNNPQYTNFGGSSQMKSGTFKFTSDGGFIISGSNQSDDNSSMLMIKTKADGKL